MRPGPCAKERRLRRSLFWVFFALFVLCSHGYIDNSDAEVEYQTTRALALRLSPGLSAGHADASVAEAFIGRTALNSMVAAGQEALPPGERVVYSWFGVGHALTMLPFYALGSAVARILPGVEEKAAQSWERAAGTAANLWREGTRDEFWARFFVSLHSPLFAALTVLLLFVLLRRLGFDLGVALWAVLLAALTTQFWPESRQSMADSSAGFFLLYSFERCVAWRQGGSSKVLAAAGALGGFAVLCRVFHVLPLAVLGIYVMLPLLRERRLRELLPFLLGALPFGLFLLAFNYWRFGTVMENGYSPGTKDGYWNFPFLHGFVLLGFSWGKGVFWFSPLLLAAPVGLWHLAKRLPAEVLVAVLLLLLPWLLNSFTTGWHSSQAWGVRYLTLGAFVLVAFGAAQLLRRCREGGRRPYLLLGIALLGLVFQLGGILTPYRGYYELGFRAVEARWPQVPKGDLIQYLVAEPRMSPLLVHWLYLGEAWSGALKREDPELGAELYAKLFATELGASAQLSWPEDRQLGHLWPIGLSRRFDSELPWLAGLLLLGFVLWGGRRIVLQVPTVAEDPCR